MSISITPELYAAARALEIADGLLITAGAGMGVDSGLPDFRGRDGFWKAYPALRQSKLQFHDIANPKAFERDANQAWGFYGHRLDLYRATQPHVGFAILQRWLTSFTKGGFVFTSNVDGQFQQAGFPASKVYECHGSIHQLQCVTPCQAVTWSASALKPIVDHRACRWLANLPQCPNCQKLARPNILMFEDWQWIDIDRQQKVTALEFFLSSCRHLVVMELGAGTEVSTVRDFSERIATQCQAPLIRINPRDSNSLLHNFIGISLGASAALHALDALLEN